MAVSLTLLLHLTLLLTLSHSHSHSHSALTDVELLLYKIKPSLQGATPNLILSSWNATTTPLCQWMGLQWLLPNLTLLPCHPLSSPHWSNLTLYKHPSLRLLSLRLPSANLSGSLPPHLSLFPALQSLYLASNSLSGPLSFHLGYSPSLSRIDLSHNLLSGQLPPSIWTLCDRLLSLNLHGNNLSGPLPPPALPTSTCHTLRALDLGDNSFSGGFPGFITGFTSIQELDLAHNMFNGTVPVVLTGLKLDKLDLSHNNFTGLLPLFQFGVGAFEGNNPSLCGYPLRSCCGGGSGLSPLSPGS